MLLELIDDDDALDDDGIFPASLPPDAEHDIGGKELHHHFPCPDGCHLSLSQQKSRLRNYSEL